MESGAGKRLHLDLTEQLGDRSASGSLNNDMVSRAGAASEDRRPLLQSGLLFRSTSWPRPPDHQLEDLKIRCDHLTKRNTALEIEVDAIK
jgi:hypothetical protein